MEKPLSVVILAAGQGTRMHSEQPKVLHPLAGRPLLEHVLAAADRLEPARICVVYGHGGEAVPRAMQRSDVLWVRQEPQRGTGHAVQQAMPHVDAHGQVLILYGDVPLVRPEPLRELVRIAASDAVGLLTVKRRDPSGYGRILRDAQGQVRGIVEHKDASAEELAIREVNTGILALPATRLAAWLERINNDNAQGEYYLTDIIAMAAAERVPILTCHPDAEWEVMGVNNRRELAELERHLQGRIAESLLAAGVTLIDPARIDVRGELICGRDCLIDVNCVFVGRVVLGENVQVGANCVLKDAEVAANVEIRPFCHLEGARIGAGAVIGPYARIRPGCALAEGVRVGNFVELKNATVGGRSKINHLSYVGDATVGERVNIGAGTITCNYDGANKHRTVIEDDAFIGSDTQLVAPVTVGRGATIGAGSTITRDAPPGELSLSRVRQLTVPGWQRPVKTGDKETGGDTGKETG